MVVRNIVGTPFWDATASIRLTKNSRSFAWIAKIRSMLRRRCRAVMDEEYVQEHILTGGIVGRTSGGAPPPSSAPSPPSLLRRLARHPPHLQLASPSPPVRTVPQPQRT